jgi:mannose-1-phosphate guanylyltransferase/mannose-6-phosphate isomerase
MAIRPIIMCGGPGARLWPASTASHPKPFIELLPGLTLFRKTLQRVTSVVGSAAPVAITGRAHAEQAVEQMRMSGIDGVVLAEPAGRDSAAALLAAALWIAREDPGAVALAVASDHHIPDDEAFAAAVAECLPAAMRGEIVTFGVRPTFAATGYGYIESGEILEAGSDVRRVRRFVEKPDISTAKTMVREGYLWNSGNFMFRLDAIIAEARVHAPDLLAVVEAAVAEATPERGAIRLGPSFLNAERRSIDVAVMEKTRRAAVLPIDYVWSDLGSWDAVWELSDRDPEGNAIDGDAVVVDSRDCLVRATPGRRLVAIGLNQVAVVMAGDSVLVSGFGGADLMKPALNALAALPAPPPGATPVIAARLARWFDLEALPAWWIFGADHLDGGFHETLDMRFHAPRSIRRVRVQARQVYVYALAGRRGWSGPWRDAVDHGLDYLDRFYSRPDGLFRSVVEPAGAPGDDAAVLYDQAFVLLALATVAGAWPARAQDMEARGVRLLAAIDRVFGAGNFDYLAVEGAPVRLTDPVMHLFEASLAWVAVRDAEPWSTLADGLARRFLDRMLDLSSGHIFETFASDWRPYPEPEKRLLMPGHHFEWAWLIERWSRLRGHSGAGAAARALFLAGEAGVDPRTGRVFDLIDERHSPVGAGSRLWPQTERAKAALLLGDTPSGQRTIYLAAAREAAAVMERYLRQDARGLWTDALDADAAPLDEVALASSFYHLAGAIDALSPA